VNNGILKSDLDPFPPIINVPDSWEAVWVEIFNAIGRSIDK
jgi:hypothetical protein